MPRQPMLGALLAAATIALVQCGRTFMPQAPQDVPPSTSALPSPDSRPGDAPLHSGQAPRWLDELELNPPPAHGPGGPASPQDAAATDAPQAAALGQGGLPASSAAQGGPR
jgi:hypothetical protein